MDLSPTQNDAVNQSISFDDYLIRIVRSGIGFLREEKFALLYPGAVFLIRPGEKKHIGMLSEPEFLDFHFDDAAAALMRSNAPAFASRNIRTVDPGVLDQLVRLENEYRQEQQIRRPGVQLALLEKQLAAERLIFQHGRDQSEIEGKIAQTLCFIAENYGRDVTLQDLAGPTGLSVSYYRRTFRNLLGCSPIDCLLDHRLFRAAGMLSRTEKSIAHVAQECGFNDPNYFSRLFTRRKGMTPRAWRRSCRKN